MPFYRKKFIVQAEQWYPGLHVNGVVALPSHVADRLASTKGLAWIETLEGGHIVSSGDWIVTGIQGEKHPVKDDIFRATYELVEDTVHA